MNKFIDQAFKKMNECFELFNKGIEAIPKSALRNGTKIKIKKGSTVYLGNDVYATLSKDVLAVVKEK